MPDVAVYLGGGTVADAIPGASATLAAVGKALEDLKGVASAQLQALASLAGELQTQADAVAAAKIAIRIPATADFQVQLDAAISLSAGFTAQLTNPAAYLQTLLDGLVAVQSNLSLATPTVALDAQVAASAALVTDFTAKIAAVDAELAALVTIGAALDALRDLALRVIAALQVAIAAVSGAIAAYLALADLLLASGVHCFLYTGTLGGAGAALDAVSGSAGIAALAPVRMPIVVVESGNLEGVAGVDAVFRVT